MSKHVLSKSCKGVPYKLAFSGHVTKCIGKQTYMTKIETTIKIFAVPKPLTDKTEKWRMTRGIYEVSSSSYHFIRVVTIHQIKTSIKNGMKESFYWDNFLGVVIAQEKKSDSFRFETNENFRSAIFAKFNLTATVKTTLEGKLKQYVINREKTVY